MEVARLAIVLQAEQARRQLRTLVVEGERVAKSADEAARRWQAAFSSMGRTVSGPVGEIRRLDREIQQLKVQLSGLASAAAQASKSLASGGPTSVAGGASAATKSVSTLEGSVKRLVATFLTFEAARRFVRAATEASIDFENIQNVLELVTGSAAEARQQFRFLQAESDRIGISFRDTAMRFARFEAAAKDSTVTVRQMKETFVVVAEAARRFGLDASQQGRILTALEQMVSKGVVSMEELRQQLGDALPGAFGVAARAMGMTTAEFNKLVSSGKLLTADFIGPFTRELAKFAPAGASVASTAAELNKLKNAWDRFLASQGIQTPVKFAAKVGTAILNDLSTTDEERMRQNAARMRETGRAVEQLRREGMLRDVSLDPNLARMGVPFSAQRQGVGPGGRVRNIWDEMWQDSLVRRFFDPSTTVDDSALIEQRVRLNRLRDERSREIAQRGPGGIAGHFQAFADVGTAMFQNLQRQATPNPEQAAAFQKEMNKLTMETLEGRERIVESWRQEEERIRSLGLTVIQTEQLRQQAVKSRNAELKKFDDEQAVRSETKHAEELTAGYNKLLGMTNNLRLQGLSPLDAAVEKINQQFREEQNELLVLEEMGLDTAEAFKLLAQAKDKALRDARAPRNRAGFTGETVAQLRAGVREDERGLLTEDDAEEFQAASQRIQDRSAELSRRLKADRATVGEAWSIGWEQQVKAFGSFAERVASASAGVADTLDRNFTDAFSSMITGTKSVQAAFRDMANAILSDLARIAIRQFIVQPALGSLGGLFGGGAASGAAATGASVGASSGVAGLGTAAGQGGAIADFASFFNNGVQRVVVAARASQKAPQVTVVNSFDMKDVEEHLAANPNAVLNPLSRRAGTVKRMFQS